MTEAQIKHLVDRFLGWRMPENFSPDDGISFRRSSHNGKPYPMPTGTNLFDATQAETMVRHMVEGMPQAADTPTRPVDEIFDPKSERH